MGHLDPDIKHKRKINIRQREQMLQVVTTTVIYLLASDCEGRFLSILKISPKPTMCISFLMFVLQIVFLYDNPAEVG